MGLLQGHRTLVFLSLVILAASQRDVTFIGLGDWGDTFMPGQQRVADQMAEWANIREPQFVVTLGDNFYQWGVNSTEDPQWDFKWKDVYNHTSLRELPWYVSVGNHDYGFPGGEWNQVEYSKIEPRWVFPHLWHQFRKHAGRASVDFFMIDTYALRQGINNHTEMMRWLEDGLANSNADWKIVGGHRHIFSSGEQGPIDGKDYDEILPLLEAYGVDMYLVGHEHNLQHMRKMHGVDVEYVVSGAGGALWMPYVEEAETSLRDDYNVSVEYFLTTWGFVGFIITETEMRMEFVDQWGESLYNYTRYKL